MIWTSADVASALGLTPRVDEQYSAVQTDTRTLEADALFVALAGDRFDAHEFLEAAAAAGARGAVVRRGTPPVATLTLYEVDDTLVALGALARERRRRLSGPVVAITGTNGKTSTKEMVAAVLATRWQTSATRANQNNLIGVPLTILEAPPETEALVVEAGANEVGEIARLRDIIEPTVGVVTNVSAGHLAGFGSLQNVLREKTALLAGASHAVVGPDPPELAARSGGFAPTTVAGLERPADLRPDQWSLDGAGRVHLVFRGYAGTVPAAGRHQGINAMIALAVGEILGVDPALALPALEQVSLPSGRGEVQDVGSLQIINDAYNANPASTLASLDAAMARRGDRPLVVMLGTMLEMGPDSDRFHRDVAEQTLARNPALVGAIGAFVSAFQEAGVDPDRFVTADDPESLGAAVRERLRGNELVLLKASRGVELDRALAALTANNGA